MKKTHKIILNTITLIVFNVLFWLCNIYPKHIIELSSSNSLLLIIINVVYFIGYFLFLQIVFSINKTLFSKKCFSFSDRHTKILYIGKITSIVLFQVIIDLIYATCLQNIGVKFEYIGTSIVILLQWVVLYFTFADKNVLCKKNVKSYVLSIVVIVVFSCFSILFDVHLMSNYLPYTTKYLENSLVVISVKNNFDYYLSIKNLIYDLIIGTVFIVTHIKVNDEEANVEKTIARDKAVLILRVFVILIMLPILCGVKFIISPSFSVIGNQTNTSVQTYYESIGNVVVKSNTYEIFRSSSDASSPLVIFQNSSIEISAEKTESVYISKTTPYKMYSYTIKNNTVIENDWLDNCSVDNVEAYLYDSQVLYYGSEDKGNLIKLTDIYDYKRDADLLLICKNLISNGNIFIFEYTCDYFLKYDRDFILPYIERYANGNFTDLENEWMINNSYRADFVINIAKTYEQ